MDPTMVLRSSCPPSASHPCPHISTSIIRHHRRLHTAAMAAPPFNVREESDSAASVAGDALKGSGRQQYTSMKEDPLKFWEKHEPLRERSRGGWERGDEKEEDGGAEVERRMAELRLVAVAAADRAEMHSILGAQRDNWNKLFQGAVRSGCATSCVLSAIGSALGSPAPFTPAALLCLTTAATMALVNYFQPSQLAEEQRTAARLFRSLVADIEMYAALPRSLLPPPAVLLRQVRRRLAALDAAFPMPLTPGGLEKFPAHVRPTVLRTSLPLDLASAASSNQQHPSTELLRVANLLRDADVPKYTGWAQNLVNANKVLAVAAPALALAASALNAAAAASGSAGGLPASCLCVVAAFVNSCSHDLQIGMVVELYRNSAGYYADLEQTIREAALMPEEERLDPELFRQRVAYRLGRSPTDATLVSADDTMAGTLF